MPYCGFLFPPSSAAAAAAAAAAVAASGYLSIYPPRFLRYSAAGGIQTRKREGRGERAKRCQAGSIATRDRDVEEAGRQERGRLTNGQKQFSSSPLSPLGDVEKPITKTGTLISLST